MIDDLRATWVHVYMYAKTTARLDRAVEIDPWLYSSKDSLFVRPETTLLSIVMQSASLAGRGSCCTSCDHSQLYRSVQKKNFASQIFKVRGGIGGVIRKRRRRRRSGEGDLHLPRLIFEQSQAHTIITREPPTRNHPHRCCKR